MRKARRQSSKQMPMFMIQFLSEKTFRSFSSDSDHALASTYNIAIARFLKEKIFPSEPYAIPFWNKLSLLVLQMITFETCVKTMDMKKAV
jgi:hypothetical protein